MGLENGTMKEYNQFALYTFTLSSRFMPAITNQ